MKKSPDTLAAPDDTEQVPFPGYSPRSETAACYTITRMGRVRRVGNPPLLVIPIERQRSGEGVGALIIKIAGGTVSRSLPRAVWEAFGDPSVVPDDGIEWVAWQDPDAPIDKETGTLRCSVRDVYLVPRGEAQQYALYGVLPTHRIPIED